MSFSLSYFNDGYSIVSLSIFNVTELYIQKAKIIQFMSYILSQLQVIQIRYHLVSMSLSLKTLAFTPDIHLQYSDILLPLQTLS